MFSEKNRNPVIKLNSIPENGCKIVLHDDIPLAVFRMNGYVYALDNRCPHRGGSLGNGELKNGIVPCPVHEWQFAINMGICTQNNEIKVKSYPVEVLDEKVSITIG